RLRRGGVSPARAAELDGVVGGVAASPNAAPPLVARLLGPDGPAGGAHDALGSGYARPAELLNHDGHGRTRLRGGKESCYRRERVDGRGGPAYLTFDTG